VSFVKGETKMNDLSLTYENALPAVNYNLIFGVAKSLIGIATKSALAVVIVYATLTQIKQYNQTLFVPMRIELKESEAVRTKKALAILNCPKEKIDVMTKSITSTSKILPTMYFGGTPIDNNILVAVLMETESEFSVNAVSSMGYKSLMQTPTATKRPITDTAHGLDILQEKLQIAKGDLESALTYYKGSRTLYDAKGNITLGHKQALEVIAKYKKVVDKIKVV
jgi:hypothetical protein